MIILKKKNNPLDEWELSTSQQQQQALQIQQQEIPVIQLDQQEEIPVIQLEKEVEQQQEIPVIKGKEISATEEHYRVQQQTFPCLN